MEDVEMKTYLGADHSITLHEIGEVVIIKHWQQLKPCYLLGKILARKNTTIYHECDGMFGEGYGMKSCKGYNYLLEETANNKTYKKIKNLAKNDLMISKEDIQKIKLKLINSSRHPKEALSPIWKDYIEQNNIKYTGKWYTFI